MNEALSLAAVLCGMETADALLTALCQAAHEALALQLREGITPEDCGKAFPLAVAALASESHRDALGTDQITGFTAGSVSLSVGREGDGFSRAVVSLLRPWLRDGAFGFRRV